MGHQEVMYVQRVYNGLLSPCDARSIEAMFVLLR